MQTVIHGEPQTTNNEGPWSLRLDSSYRMVSVIASIVYAAEIGVGFLVIEAATSVSDFLPGLGLQMYMLGVLFILFASLGLIGAALRRRTMLLCTNFFHILIFLYAGAFLFQFLAAKKVYCDGRVTISLICDVVDRIIAGSAMIFVASFVSIILASMCRGKIGRARAAAAAPTTTVVIQQPVSPMRESQTPSSTPTSQVICTMCHAVAGNGPFCSSCGASRAEQKAPVNNRHCHKCKGIAGDGPFCSSCGASRAEQKAPVNNRHCHKCKGIAGDGAYCSLCGADRRHSRGAARASHAAGAFATRHSSGRQSVNSRPVDIESGATDLDSTMASELDYGDYGDYSENSGESMVSMVLDAVGIRPSRSNSRRPRP